MIPRIPFLVFIILHAILLQGAEQPPVIPIGLDAYKMWER